MLEEPTLITRQIINQITNKKQPLQQLKEIILYSQQLINNPDFINNIKKYANIISAIKDTIRSVLNSSHFDNNEVCF